MSKKTLYLIGIIVVAIIAALLQYQNCCSPEAIATKNQQALIDKDNTDVLPKMQIAGLAAAGAGAVNFLFNSGSDELATQDDAAKAQVNAVVSELSDAPHKALQITGQYREGQPYELGMERAGAIAKVFTDAGLADSQVVTKVEKVAEIPTQGAKSLASALEIVTDKGKQETLRLLESGKTALADAKATIETVTAEKADIAEKLTAITEEKDSLAQKLSSAISETEQVAAQLASVSKEKSTLERESTQQLSISAANLVKADETIASLKASLAEQTTALGEAKAMAATQLKLAMDSQGSDNNATISALNEQIDAVTAKNSELKQNLEKISADTKATVETLNAEKDSVVAQLAALTQAKSAFETQSAQQLSISAANLLKADETIASLKASLAEKTTALGEAKAMAATQLKLAMDSQGSDTNATISALNEQIDAVTTKNSELKQSLAQISAETKATVETLNAEKDSLVAQLAALTQAKSAFETQSAQQLSISAANLVKADETIASLKASLAEQTTALGEAKAMADAQLKLAMDSQDSDTNATISALNEQIDSITAQNSELKQNLEKNSADNKATIETLNAEKDSVVAQLAALTQAKSAFEQESAKQLSISAANLVKADETIAALEDKVETITDENMTLKQQLAQAISAEKSVSEQLSVAELNLGNLTAKLDTTNAALNMTKKQLGEALRANVSQPAQLVVAEATKPMVVSPQPELVVAIKPQMTADTTKTSAMAVSSAAETVTEMSADDSQTPAMVVSSAAEIVAEMTSENIVSSSELSMNNHQGNKATAMQDDQAMFDALVKSPLVLYFKTNQSNISLNDEQTQKIALIKSYLSHVTDAKLLVTGHTDNTGKRSMNIKLGLKRANFAADWLSQSGIPRERMVIDSKGPDTPMVSNNSKENRALNRRVEVTFQ